MTDQHCGSFVEHGAHDSCDGTARPLEAGEMAIQDFAERPAARYVFSQPDLLHDQVDEVTVRREDDPETVLVEEFDAAGELLREHRLPPDHILVRALLADPSTYSSRGRPQRHDA